MSISCLISTLLIFFINIRAGYYHWKLTHRYLVRDLPYGRPIVISLSICHSVWLSILKSIRPSEISCCEHIFSSLGQIWLIFHQLVIIKGAQWPCFWVKVIAKSMQSSSEIVFFLLEIMWPKLHSQSAYGKSLCSDL